MKERGSMQHPPNYPYRPYYRPPVPPWYKRLWRWYRSRSKRTQILIAAGLVVLMFISVISNNTNASPPASTPTTSIATTAPTDVPTADPNDNATASADEATVEAQVSASMTASVPTPTPRPTTVVVRPTPTPVHTGVNGNPWGYDFSPGGYIYNPPTDFCSYFNCISNFWNGHGFVNECNDGSYSLSGGIRGDCSYHGGEMRPLYSH